ncbi:MAG: GTPase HflX [Kiritimatiellaeota bacterium]|nr:GTPase HflX [Kiritimatiellota bacterium]
MIDTEKDNMKMVERAILVGVRNSDESEESAEEQLRELKELVNTMGAPVIHETTVKLRKPSARFLIGGGKAEEIANLAREREADCLIFNCDLSPSQQRNWEKLTKICVIDRQEVILDIFAARASTREAVLQVELARLEYLEYSLPRLTRAWTHLSRQQGGAKGTRGEGEKQIEVDRRLVSARISRLKKELEVVVKQREVQRKRRNRSNIPHAAIVGYTNAGKSSLLNLLSSSEVLVGDKLFATLDHTTRRITLPNGRDLLLTDTVGFVRRLPHALVEAFKSTLEEAVLADFIILVLDASDPYLNEHKETTLSVLSELGAIDREMIMVLNKSDLVGDAIKRACLESGNPGALPLSTVTGKGLPDLLERLEKMIDCGAERLELLIPPSRHDIIAMAHGVGEIVEMRYETDGTAKISLIVPRERRNAFAMFLLD